MDHLLKATIVWTIFLLLFEALYKNNGRFTVNRIYLVASLCLGLLIPLISLPVNAPAIVSKAQLVYTATQNTIIPQAVPSQENVATITAYTDATNSDINWHPSLSLIIGVIYGLGVLLLLAKCLVELYKLMLLMHRKPTQMLHGHKVIETVSIHSPYSFMGRIFITSAASYSPQELKYIIQHEAAHNTRKHWADLWLVQLACIILWFHPLVWRFRYLLQLQHEYEADHMAARTDPYTYGHFLLQQTLLTAVPSMAHSFHFSPIKNRINMLTKKQGVRTPNLRYLLLVPVLLSCTFIMAKNAADTPNYKNNDLTWRATDTLFFNRITKHVILVNEYQKEPRQVVTSINGDVVYQNEYVPIPASSGDSASFYTEYVRTKFIELVKNTKDSTTKVDVAGLVINKDGKVMHYDVRYQRPFSAYTDESLHFYPFLKPEPALDAIIEKIITEGPTWKPAMKDGKPVNSYVSYYVSGC